MLYCLSKFILLISELKTQLPSNGILMYKTHFGRLFNNLFIDLDSLCVASIQISH